MTDREQLDAVRAILDPEDKYPLIPLVVLAKEAMKRRKMAAPKITKEARNAKAKAYYWSQRQKGLCTLSPCQNKAPHHSLCERHRAKRNQ